MVDLNPNIATIKLNMDGLNTLIKRQQLSQWILNEIHLYSVYEKDTDRLKVKKLGKINHTNTHQWKTE